VFEPISFNTGLSVILAEIRVPANRDLDTHNLGKTTVGQLIDYCLLKGKSSSFFLFQYEDRFADYSFFLELELLDGSFLTIGRPVVPGSRIDILRSETPVDDATTLPIESWSHLNLAFEKAKVLLDGILNLSGVQPWAYRKLVGYLLRSQADYLDVFQLGKFSGKHQDWKPFVAHLLGLKAQPAIELYAKREELAEADGHLKSLLREWGGDDVDSSVLDGLISVKRREIENRSATLDTFNFEDDDQRVTSEVVESLEAEIARLNEEHYRNVQLVRRLAESLEDEKILFRTDDAEALFREAGVAFGEQIKKDYSQLIAFNRAISKERRDELKRQMKDAQAQVARIGTLLPRLNEERSRKLSFLRDSETLGKFKELSNELTTLRSELLTLESRRSAAARMAELRREYRALEESFAHLQTAVEQEIEEISQSETSRFGKLRNYFNEIVYAVLGQHAILAVSMNGQGGLDFTAEFVGDSGNATSGDRGTSYKKLLCIAFDLALLRAHLDVPFARFVFHDGALEQLEPRKRQNLLQVLRQYADLGLQPIITALDSDLPEPVDSSDTAIRSEDVILTLHDEGATGRLFRVEPW